MNKQLETVIYDEISPPCPVVFCTGFTSNEVTATVLIKIRSMLLTIIIRFAFDEIIFKVIRLKTHTDVSKCLLKNDQYAGDEKTDNAI